MRTAAQGLRTHGFAVVADVVDDATCDLAIERFGKIDAAGSRRLLLESWCAAIAGRLRAHHVIATTLPADAVAVQCTVFAKSPTKNWLVSLHQDRSIPVRNRLESDELTGWAEKEGDLFVQPPAAVLEKITAVRVHLDPCPLESGPLKVVPASHDRGILKSKQADELRGVHGEHVIPAARGAALIIKPLILHASSKATSLTHRRVLHFVFGPRWLPLGLEWQHASNKSLERSRDR